MKVTVVRPQSAMRLSVLKKREPGYVSDEDEIVGEGKIMFIRKDGTDTVPAILTPGEVVISTENVPRVAALLKEAGIDDIPGFAKGGRIKKNVLKQKQSMRNNINIKIHIGTGLRPLHAERANKGSRKSGPTERKPSVRPPLSQTFASPLMIPVPMYDNPFNGRVREPMDRRLYTTGIPNMAGRFPLRTAVDRPSVIGSLASLTQAGLAPLATVSRAVSGAISEYPSAPPSVIASDVLRRILADAGSHRLNNARLDESFLPAGTLRGEGSDVPPPSSASSVAPVIIEEDELPPLEDEVPAQPVIEKADSDAASVASTTDPHNDQEPWDEFIANPDRNERDAGTQVGEPQIGIDEALRLFESMRTQVTESGEFTPLPALPRNSDKFHSVMSKWIIQNRQKLGIDDDLTPTNIRTLFRKIGSKVLLVRGALQRLQVDSSLDD